MVVGKLFEMVDSRRSQLKFGIDAILAKDIPKSSHFNNDISCCSPIRPCFTSNIRCCTAPAASHRFPHPFYRTPNIHAPQPLRPYTNVLVRAESSSDSTSSSNPSQKRKRSWSRAVFSNLQRKGLEKRFQLQKYITKPDRRQLAATLGLTDAQVKVWFQNRRMKWRHTKEGGGRDDVGEGVKAAAESPMLTMTADSTQQGATAHASDSESDIDVQTVDCE